MTVRKNLYPAILAFFLLVVPPSLGGLTDAVVQITRGPSGTTTETSATFDFSVTQRDVAYTTCSLDGAASRCSSPVTYSGLAPGDHTFAVTAHDGRGGTLGSDSRGWTVGPV